MYHARNTGFIVAVIVYCVISLAGTRCFAQKRQPSSFGSLPPQFTRLSFSQKLNIYEWNYLLNFSKTVDDRLRFGIKEDFSTTLQSISSRDLWKDTQTLTMSLDYPFSSTVSLGAEVFSHILTDPLTGFDNDVKFHSGTASLTYTPTPGVQISPSVSSRWQTQQQQSDQAFGYGLSANISEFEFYGYRSELSLNGEQDQFPERRNQDFSVRYRIQRQFYESTADTLILFVNRLRRDSFDSGVTGLFVRNLTQTNKGVENRLSYRIDDNTTLYLNSVLKSSGFRVNNFRQDSTDVRKDDSGFESRHALNVNHKRGRWHSRLQWISQFRSRDDNRPRQTSPDPFGRFPTVGFDTEETLVTLNMNNGFRLSRTDSLSLFASVSKFKYETSDTTNPNDHDQIKWQVTFSHSHQFNADLRLTWRASAFLKHFVFISSKFSGGNNWERNFQLSPEIVYSPDGPFTFRQRFTVRAKYQTYDFDDPVTSNRNIANRQYIVTNRSRYALTANDRIEFGFNIELAEQGKLFYDLWRQRLALSWRNAEIQLLHRHSFGSSWQLASGGSFFRQTRWEHRLNPQGERQKNIKDRHTNFGPVVELSFRPSQTLQVLFLGNIQFSKSSRRNTETINNFDLNVNWFF